MMKDCISTKNHGKICAEREYPDYGNLKTYVNLSFRLRYENLCPYIYGEKKRFRKVHEEDGDRSKRSFEERNKEEHGVNGDDEGYTNEYRRKNDEHESKSNKDFEEGDYLRNDDEFVRDANQNDYKDDIPEDMNVYKMTDTECNGL